MSNRQDKKMARLMTDRLIKFRGWKDGVSWWRRRRHKKYIYRDILCSLENMTREISVMFTLWETCGLIELMTSQKDHEFNVE